MRMPIASFEEEQKLVQKTSDTQSQHFLGMSGWLVRKGLAANQTSADLTLLVLAGLVIVLSAFAYKIGSCVGLPSPDDAVIMRTLAPPPT
ncbi:MAG: hypothetical protein Q8K93_17975 [Reyranella sp.]|nr:hypothetical protein [Reyranella sp.]